MLLAPIKDIENQALDPLKSDYNNFLHGQKVVQNFNTCSKRKININSKITNIKSSSTLSDKIISHPQSNRNVQTLDNRNKSNIIPSRDDKINESERHSPNKFIINSKLGRSSTMHSQQQNAYNNKAMSCSNGVSLFIK